MSVARRQPKKKTYTDAQKAAYYRKMALENSRPLPARARQSRAPPAKPPGIISQGGQAVGTAIGGSLGGAPGAAIGNFLGGKLGHLVEKVTGFGEYQVSQNSILKGGMSPPQIVNSVDTGSVIVRHREYLGDILASTDFSVQSFMINPGLSSTFPWLSSMANSFEQYRLRGMLFEFNSTSSDSILSAATSTALGTVIMQTDYDVADNPPVSKREMLNCEFSSSAKPSVSFIHPIECKKSLSFQSILFTRGTLVTPDNFDQRLYDFARFNIAVEGCQAAVGVLGELWVTYEMELFKQQFNYVGATDHFEFDTVTAARPLGTITQTNAAGGGTLGGAITDDGFNYEFPPQLGSGKYLVVYSVYGTVAGAVVQPGFTPVNASFINVLNGSISALSSPQDGVSSTRLIIYSTVQITKQNSVLSFGLAGVYPTGTQRGDLFITRIPDSMV